MGTTRTEQAIDDIDALRDDTDFSCEDVRLAWLASEFDGACDGADFDPVWTDR